MGNPFVYVQLQTKDLPAAKKFYKELLEWSLEDSQDTESGYTEIVVGEGTAGGIMKSPSPSASSHWLPYVGVDDVQAVTSRAESLGGRVILQPTEIPGKGRYSIVVDPSGASIAFWQVK